MGGKIELTPQELEEIKDEVKFRTKVIIELKRLNGIPERVNRLEIWHRVFFWVLSGITLTLFWMVIKSINHYQP